mgnify:FL=1
MIIHSCFHIFLVVNNLKRDKPKYKQIIDAAVIAIAESGYHQAQVSKIAKQAGVADGTIYLYFKNKEDILISLFEEKMSVFVDNLKLIIKDENSASEKLGQMIENHFQVLANDRHLATVTQLELRQSNKEIRLKINAILKEYLKMIDQIIIEGMVSGEFKPSMDVRIARQMVFGTIDEISTTWVMNENRYNLMDLAPKVKEMLLNGVKA